MFLSLKLKLIALQLDAFSCLIDELERGSKADLDELIRLRDDYFKRRQDLINGAKDYQ